MIYEAEILVCLLRVRLERQRIALLKEQDMLTPKTRGMLSEMKRLQFDLEKDADEVLPLIEQAQKMRAETKPKAVAAVKSAAADVREVHQFLDELAKLSNSAPSPTDGSAQPSKDFMPK